MTFLFPDQVRLTNEKIAVVFAVEGAKECMFEMGWVEEGDFLVLPAGVQLSFNKEVRDIEDAKAKLKKETEQAMMRAACGKKTETPEMKRLREQLEADKRERAAQGPITKPSVAVPKGQGGIQQFEPPPSSC